MIEDLWYKNAVIYALNLDSFMDGNGDGVGDFEGLTRRLDYLESLGIDAIWLGPFQPTPNRDHGYDISDFYGVDKRFGSSGDFVEFMQRGEPAPILRARFGRRAAAHRRAESDARAATHGAVGAFSPQSR